MAQRHDFFSNLATFFIGKGKLFFHMDSVLCSPLRKKYVVKSGSRMSNETRQVKMILLPINRENKLSSNMVKGR